MFALRNTNTLLPIVLVNIPFPAVPVTESTMLASASPNIAKTLLTVTGNTSLPEKPATVITINVR